MKKIVFFIILSWAFSPMLQANDDGFTNAFGVVFGDTVGFKAKSNGKWVGTYTSNSTTYLKANQSVLRSHGRFKLIPPNGQLYGSRLGATEKAYLQSADDPGLYLYVRPSDLRLVLNTKKTAFMIDTTSSKTDGDASVLITKVGDKFLAVNGKNGNSVLRVTSGSYGWWKKFRVYIYDLADARD